jgi:hypothetical protein
MKGEVSMLKQYYLVQWDNGESYEDNIVNNELICLDEEIAKSFVDAQNFNIKLAKEKYDSMVKEIQTAREVGWFKDGVVMSPGRIPADKYFTSDEYTYFCALKEKFYHEPDQHYTYEAVDFMDLEIADLYRTGSDKCKEVNDFAKCSHCIFDGGQANDYSKCSRCTSNPNSRDFFQSADPASEELYRTLTKDGHCTFDE